MKYLLGIAILSMALVGCETASNKKTVDSTATVVDSSHTIQNTVQVLHFTGPQDLTITLKTTDNFETAEMVDNSDKVYYLKRVISGSGIRLANENGVAIHFKTNMNNINEGTVELMPEKYINITEFKGK